MRGPALALPIRHHVDPCGSAGLPGPLVEPPNVEVWNLPRNASGERELILAVHRSAGRYCYRYTLNGQVQTVAPVIRVRRGEQFALRIVNDLAGESPGEHVASTQISACMPMLMPNAALTHYVGYLNHTIDDRYMKPPHLDTNIHLHGFEGPADEENVFLSTLSTPMHACEYRVTIPSTQPPGTYFYHPHVHGASDAQIALGLGGVWIVEADQPQIEPSADHVILLRYRYPIELDNMLAPDEDPLTPLAENHTASLKPAPVVAYDPFNPPPWPVTFPMNAAGVRLDPTGCDGLAAEPLISVDGADAPATLQVPAGQTQLLRIVNATSDSSKKLELFDASGQRVQMRLVGLDGVPASGDAAHPLARYIPLKKFMLTPMGRMDILVDVAAGETLTLSSNHYCEGKDAFYQMHHDLLVVRGVFSPAKKVASVPSAPLSVTETPAARLVAYAHEHPSLVRRRAITFTEYAFPKNGKIPEHQSYYITDTTDPNFHEHPFWPIYRGDETIPANPDIVVHAGTVEEWYLINATMEAHAFHIHQMAFAEENTNGVALTGDTAFLPVGQLLPNPGDPNYPLIKPTITKVLLDFRHVPRGTFVFHCHMLFHEDHGMMAIVKVM